MEGYRKHPYGGGLVKDGVLVPASVYVGQDAIIRGGTIEGGTIEGGTIRGGTIYGGTIRGGTIYGGTIRGGTIRGGTIRGGTIRGGTIEGGLYRNSTYTPLGVTDAGYFVSANFVDGAWRIEAGGRDFTLKEAIAHWGSPDYHTPQSGSRIVAALRWLAEQPTLGEA